jgi:starch phosphorylase
MPEKKIKIGDEVTRQGVDKESLKKSFLDHIAFSLAKDKYSATKRDYYLSLALAIRDRLVERWVRTQQKYYQVDAKRVYYLSLEFLMGRSLGNSIMNLEMDFACRKALEELGFDLEEMMDVEWDAGLGNGGLGRLAACYLDSMAFHALPAYGYGIRYEYGIFFQKVQNGYQVETPDNWLRYQNPWELPRPEHLYPVKFYGRVEVDKWPDGRPRFLWQDGEEVMAMAYDTPVPGHGNDTVNTLRLWSAKATREFDLSYFNSGDYVSAVEDKNQKENITRVLYPSDNVYQGKELRLKQQYFFVSATLQDAIRRYKKTQPDMKAFPEKTVFQLNDTHPSIAIPEMMRLLMDQEGMEWQEAWEITGQVFAYTNHTVLPEALEHWPVAMIERMLPRHWQIIGEINRRLMDEVEKRHPGDQQKKQAMSIISAGPEPQVRMAHLAITGCFSVNGVAELHTRILRERVFPEFNEFFPGKFNNKTNGITPRRWLKKCNPGLSELITKQIGPEWVKNLSLLKELAPLAGDSLFRERWRVIKRENKIRLAEYIRTHNELEINVNSMFDVQVKRFHEYKRQLLNVLGVIAQYNRIKKDPAAPVVPRTVIFGGKAAPGYFMAKLIIKLINCVADQVNNDPDIGNKLKVVFLANYGVSLAELIMPAAELSQQISTAGMEASGTGNMKFALNGALTIGTLDGANIEIMEEVGQDNIFIFGLKTEEVADLRVKGYDPKNQYHSNGQLKEVLDQLEGGFFCREDPDLFKPIVDSLLNKGDYYLLLADFASYMECQDRVSRTYQDPDQWTERAIINVANMGKFSSDRSIKEYAEQIWQAQSVPIE